MGKRIYKHEQEQENDKNHVQQLSQPCGTMQCKTTPCLSVRVAFNWFRSGSGWRTPIPHLGSTKFWSIYKMCITKRVPSVWLASGRQIVKLSWSYRHGNLGSRVLLEVRKFQITQWQCPENNAQFMLLPIAVNILRQPHGAQGKEGNCGILFSSLPNLTFYF